MRQVGDLHNVALRGAGRQSSGGSHALDVPDHRRHFYVVAQSGEFGHQTDAGAGRRSHSTSPHPASAQHHADGGKFVFRLHDTESRFAIRTDAMLFHVLDQILNQRRRRSDGIPRHNADAGEHGAQRGGGVAVDDDLAFGLVHPLHAERIFLGQRLRSVVVSCLRGVPVQVGSFHFRRELLANRLFHFFHVEVEKLRNHADVDHVLHKLAELGFLANLGDDLVEGDGIERHVAPQFAQVQRLVIENDCAGFQRKNIVFSGLGIHRDDEIDFLLASDEAILAGADCVPRRQAGNIRRKEILARDRDAHLENRAEQNRVRRLRTRTIDRRHLDAEIVDDRRPLRSERRRSHFCCCHVVPLS